MEQRRTVLLADTSTEFRILLREAMEKTGEFWVDELKPVTKFWKKFRSRNRIF